MDERFYEELSTYTIEDLELVIRDQGELYSEEEMRVIKTVLEEKRRIHREEHRKKVLERLPKTIPCPKCDGPNSFAQEKCDFCGAKLDKEKYYREAEREPVEEDEEEEGTTERKDGYTFHYVISFLIPLCGFIMGAIMLANDDEEKAAAGKWCIIWGLISMVVSAVLSGILIGLGLW